MSTHIKTWIAERPPHRPGPTSRQKPHLRLRHGIWVCGPRLFSSVQGGGLLLGHGYTPAQAYRDWAEQSTGVMPA